MNLDNRDWKEFFFEEIFSIDSTSSGIDRNKLIKCNGLFPYLTRSEKNNGLDSFICKQSGKYKIDDSNVIIIGLDTQTVFYQPHKFYTGQNIQLLKCKNLNKEIAQFLISLIKRQLEKFNWGSNGATLARLRRSKLLLPLNRKGKPDFAFMEAFIKRKAQEKIAQYKDYINNKLVSLQDIKNVESLDEKDWKEFSLTYVFNEIQRGKRLKKGDQKRGMKPYISSTLSNNGIDGFIGNEKKVRIFKNCLTIANSGSIGSTFFQPFEFIASDHITKLKNTDYSKHVYHFLCAITKRLHEKYGFNRELNDNRIKREKILLPVDQKSEPDYEYMENYMRQLEHKKLNEYLSYKQRGAM